MATTIIYSVSGDFSSGVHISQLSEEIQGSAITVVVSSIIKNGDNVLVNFQLAPTAGDIIILDGLVAAHVATFIEGGVIEIQPAEESLVDANVIVTSTMLVKRILRITPSTTRTLTLDTPINLLNLVQGVDDSLTFSIINENNANTIIVNPSSGSTVGNNTIAISSSAIFRLRFTNITASSEAYNLYRLA